MCSNENSVQSKIINFLKSCLFTLFSHIFNICNIHVLLLKSKLLEGLDCILFAFISKLQHITLECGMKRRITLLLLYFQNMFTHIRQLGRKTLEQERWEIRQIFCKDMKLPRFQSTDWRGGQFLFWLQERLWRNMTMLKELVEGICK